MSDPQPARLPPPLPHAPPPLPPTSERLLSLDVFRGLVILAMLLVNNISWKCGYFLAHAAWPNEKPGSINHRHMSVAFENWWAGPAQDGIGPAVSWFPLLRYCTLADFVMPWFMLIIGVAIPYAAASARSRGVSEPVQWLRTTRRAGMLVFLGVVLVFAREDFTRWAWRASAESPVAVAAGLALAIATTLAAAVVAALAKRAWIGWSAWAVTAVVLAALFAAAHHSGVKPPLKLLIGMEVLQLLGIGYLTARVLYTLPRWWLRLAAAAALYAWHWAVLRHWILGAPADAGPAGNGYGGVFTSALNAIGFINGNKGAWFFANFEITSFLNFRIASILSVPPAAATMLLGSLAADWLRQTAVRPAARAAGLIAAGAVVALLGAAWAFDLPMHKDRWVPAYLVYTSGIGAIVLGACYLIVDVWGWNRIWTWPLVALGVNSIAAYWIPILAKILLLNVPRAQWKGDWIPLSAWVERWLADGKLGAGLGEITASWIFTLAFIAVWLAVFLVARAYRLVWKL